MEFHIVAEGGRLFRSAFDSILDLGDRFRIAVAPFVDTSYLGRVREAGFSHGKVTFAGEPCYIICNGLRLHAQPRISSSPGSQAIYLGEWDNGAHSYLLQQMPPYSVTSRHYHDLTTERFHGLSGEAIIENHGVDVVLSGDTLQIDTRRIHQLRTRRLPALTLIEMIGNPRGLRDMSDHRYVPEGLELI